MIIPSTIYSNIILEIFSQTVIFKYFQVYKSVFSKETTYCSPA